jgi:hypothetical protein
MAQNAGHVKQFPGFAWAKRIEASEEAEKPCGKLSL